MQITVFGASGKVGSLVVEEALRRGHKVVAFVHDHSLFVPNNNLEVVTGDVYTKTDVGTVIRGSQAVLSCLGSWGTPKKNVLTAAMEAIIPAMEREKISRIVTLTGSGAAAPSAPPRVSHATLVKLLTPFPAGKVFRDGEAHMRLLAASSLDWTTVRSPVMNNFGGNAYRLSLLAGSPFATIKRQAVAASLVDLVETTEYVQLAPIIHR